MIEIGNMIVGVGLFVGTISLYFYSRSTLIVRLNEPSKVEKYNARELSQFQKLFENDTNNSNIHLDVEKWMESADEEMLWKQRILLEHTPYGNIIMYYDFYRQAFAYFSDTHLSYSTLNTCAMKYVRIFYCRDFFVDTVMLPTSFVNPLNHMKEEAEKREKEKIKKKKVELNLNFDCSVFVKPLPIDIIGAKQQELVYKNNFRYMGKFSNWDIMKRAPTTTVTTSVIVDGYANWKRNKNK